VHLVQGTLPHMQQAFCDFLVSKLKADFVELTHLALTDHRPPSQPFLLQEKNATMFNFLPSLSLFIV
jgi:hypothetical protein